MRMRRSFRRGRSSRGRRGRFRSFSRRVGRSFGRRRGRAGKRIKIGYRF